MGAGALSDDDVVKLSSKFVRIYVDCTKRSNYPEIKREYGVREYPTLVFADSRGGKPAALVGPQNRGEVLDAMRKALDIAPAPKAATPAVGKKLTQDKFVERLMKRIDEEISRSSRKLQKDLISIIRSEMKKGGVAPAKRQKKNSLADQVRKIAKRILRDGGGVNSRIRKFLGGKYGVKFIVDVMKQQGFDTVDEAFEMYFKKADRGLLKLREEFEDEAEKLLERLKNSKSAPHTQ